MLEETRYLTARFANEHRKFGLQTRARICRKPGYRSSWSVNFLTLMFDLYLKRTDVSPSIETFIVFGDVHRIISGIIRREGTSIVQRRCKFLKRAI